MAKAMLIDTELCLECNACSVECRRNNDVPVGQKTAWTTIKRYESGTFPDVKAFVIKHACNHCTEPACMEICPVDAISKPDGFHVVVNHEECVSCGACAKACPYSVPHYGTPRTTSQKCRFCYGTRADDEPTACAAACPFGAITFGERDDLIGTGKQRVALLIQKGKSDANLYGETQMGGLNVLYVLSASPAAYDLPENPVAFGSTQAATEAAVASGGSSSGWLVPSLWGGFAGIGVTGVAAAVAWALRRRMELNNGNSGMKAEDKSDSKKV